MPVQYTIFNGFTMATENDAFVRIGPLIEEGKSAAIFGGDSMRSSTVPYEQILSAIFTAKRISTLNKVLYIVLIVLYCSRQDFEVHT